jgi:hypothetical protein
VDVPVSFKHRLNFSKRRDLVIREIKHLLTLAEAFNHKTNSLKVDEIFWEKTHLNIIDALPITEGGDQHSSGSSVSQRGPTKGAGHSHTCGLTQSPRLRHWGLHTGLQGENLHEESLPTPKLGHAREPNLGKLLSLDAGA